ncbi:O-antigen polymerase [Aliarcobacter cryaerophilus]|uniref:O-antigen polymerase n=1 Tax=Aliarcobacter cryaerophilus TaxID=28198 RepID=UPI0011DF1EC8|nr:O-antigen polymerase [Aliarcobacter cryaerophilus]
MDLLFIIIFFIFPILIFKYMHKIGIDFFTISIPSFLVVSIFIFAYIGVLPLYFGWDEYRFNLGVTNKEILFKVFLFNCFTILGILFGFHFSKKFLKLDFNLTIENISSISKKDKIFLFYLLVFCFIIFLIYLSKINEIALFVRISEGYIGAEISRFNIVRSNMTNAFEGKYHWYSLVMHHILLVITLVFFISFLQKQRYAIILFIISFLLISFITIMTTEKAPFFWLVISFFITYIIVKYNSKIPIKKTIYFSIIIFISLILLYYFMMYSDTPNGFLYSIKALFSRIFAASIQPAYHYLEFFPQHHDFLYGKSFPNPNNMFPFETFYLTQEIMNFAQPKQFAYGIIGTMPTVFWAEAYSNFGLLGIFIVPFIIGIIVWAVQYYISKSENSPIKIALYVWLILHFKDLSTTGFSGFIIDFYMIFTIGLFSIYILFDNYYKRRKCIE